MADDNDRLDSHEDLIRRLIQIAAHQDTINERLTAAIERLDTTQARIETLLARVIERGANGRDA